MLTLFEFYVQVSVMDIDDADIVLNQVSMNVETSEVYDGRQLCGFY